MWRTCAAAIYAKLFHVLLYRFWPEYWPLSHPPQKDKGTNLTSECECAAFFSPLQLFANRIRPKDFRSKPLEWWRRCKLGVGLLSGWLIDQERWNVVSRIGIRAPVLHQRLISQRGKCAHSVLITIASLSEKDAICTSQLQHLTGRNYNNAVLVLTSCCDQSNVLVGPGLHVNL